MWVTRVILGIVLLHLRTMGRIWSLSCMVEERCLTRLSVTPHSRADAIMNHFNVSIEDLGVVEFSSSARHQ